MNRSELSWIVLNFKLNFFFDADLLLMWLLFHLSRSLEIPCYFFHFQHLTSEIGIIYNCHPNEILTIRWLFIYVSFHVIRDQTNILVLDHQNWIFINFYVLDQFARDIIDCYCSGNQIIHPPTSSIRPTDRSCSSQTRTIRNAILNSSEYNLNNSIWLENFKKIPNIYYVCIKCFLRQMLSLFFLSHSLWWKDVLLCLCVWVCIWVPPANKNINKRSTSLFDSLRGEDVSL